MVYNPRGSANSGASNSQYRQPFYQPTHTARKCFLRRSSHVLSLERGHRTAQPRVNYTSSLADSLDIRRTNILSSRTG